DFNIHPLCRQEYCIDSIDEDVPYADFCEEDDLVPWTTPSVTNPTSRKGQKKKSSQKGSLVSN
ncbi:hypothetical protein E4U28_005312, partial [Claviceps purpurea]